MLLGYTVGITADRRSDEQAALFERRGATVQHGASIRTLPLGSDERLRAATEAVIERRPTVFVANTGLGVRSWFSAAETWGVEGPLLETLRDARIYARGPKASGAVQQHGLEVEDRAPTERLRDAIDLAMAVLRRGDVIALQLDGSRECAEANRVRAAGIDVIELPVYEWTMPSDVAPALRLIEDVIAGRIQAMTFTAGPAIRNLMAIAAERDLDLALRRALTDGRTVVGCVGPVCAEVASAHGLASPHLVVPRTWRLGPLVRAVAERVAQRTLTVDLRGTTMTIAGNHVTVDDESLVLTDTEAGVLTMLASEPNHVYAKADLLRHVWRDEDADPHVVEAVVNRLRRRLGPSGRSISAVYRRGYTLRV